MSSKSPLDAEVSSTVKSTGSMEEDDDEVLQMSMSYKDVPDDYFDSLIVDEWKDDDKNSPEVPSPQLEKQKGPKDTAVTKKVEDKGKAADKKKVVEKENSDTSKRGRSPSKRKANSPDKANKLSPKRKRSASPKRSRSPRKRSRSPRRRSRSPLRRSPIRRSPVRRPPVRRSPVRKRSVSPVPMRRGRRSVSPRRRPSPRRRSISPKRRSVSRSPQRRKSPDFYTARMSSRRNRQRRSTSKNRNSTSISPEGTTTRISEPLRALRGYQGTRSRSPNPSFGASVQPSQPSLEEIASGAAIPFNVPGYPYGAPPIMYYPPGTYPPHPMAYPHQMQPYGGMVPAATHPHVSEAASLSTAYPLPVPVPKPETPAADYSPVMPAKPAKSAGKLADKRKFASTFQESLPSASIATSIDSEEGPSSKSSAMKLSDYLASMTASNKPMEYKKAVDDRIKNAIAKFDEAFLQPLRFTVTPVDVKSEPENTNPNMSPLLRNPAIKLGNFIRPLNLRALKLPDRPLFLCRKPELAAPKPEISIKTLLSKKQTSKRDMATSPIEFLTFDVDCQTDPIPDPPPPICFTCEERNKKTFMNHWTQVKRAEMMDSAAQTEIPRVAATVSQRLGPIVDEAQEIRDPLEDLRRCLRNNSRSNSPWGYNEEHREALSPPLMVGPGPRRRSRSTSRSRSPFLRFCPSPVAPDVDRYSPVDIFERSPTLGFRYAGAENVSPSMHSAAPIPRSRFYCGECALQLNSHQQLAEHQNSRRHLLRLEALNSPVLPYERGMREHRDIREPRDIRDSRDIREPREIRDSRNIREPRDVRDPRDMREPRDIREPREVREPRDNRQFYERRSQRPFDDKNGFNKGGSYWE